jgi:hypothetical protein
MASRSRACRLALGLGCLLAPGLLAAAGPVPAREAAAQGVEGALRRRGLPPRAAVFGVESYDPGSPAEAEAASALARRALAWLEVEPGRPPAGAGMRYRIRPAGELPFEALAEALEALSGPGPGRPPVDLEGWVRTAGDLELKLSSRERRLRLGRASGRTRLWDESSASELEPRPVDRRFARRWAVSFHASAWLAAGLGPGGRLRLLGPEPGRPELWRLLAVLPDGEPMEYLIAAEDGALRAERFFVHHPEGPGMQTVWYDAWRRVDGVRVAWAWTSERAGRPVSRGRMERWAWLPSADGEPPP